MYKTYSNFAATQSHIVWIRNYYLEKEKWESLASHHQKYCHRTNLLSFVHERSFTRKSEQITSKLMIQLKGKHGYSLRSKVESRGLPLIFGTPDFARSNYAMPLLIQKPSASRRPRPWWYGLSYIQPYVEIEDVLGTETVNTAIAESRLMNLH